MVFLRLLLQVIFDGEEAVDAGGVTKEFFLLLLKELMDPVYGMFTHYPESNLLWFSDKVSRTRSPDLLVTVYLCKINHHKALICVGQRYVLLIPCDAVILCQEIYLKNLCFMILIKLCLHQRYQIACGSFSNCLNWSLSKMQY